MRVVEAIAEVLRREGVEFLACFPQNPLIDALSLLEIRPVICRQERVGVHIADGFSRVSNGRRIGVFAMQFGPGAENAFSGVASAYSDSVPILLLPLGHRRTRSQVFPHFSSVTSYASVTKAAEQIVEKDEVIDVMRRAFSLLKVGRFGPVMVEIPEDVADEEIGGKIDYEPVRATRSAADPEDVAAAVKTLLRADSPLILAGQGVLYAEASKELIEISELMQAPVMSTLEGKSAFPEDHPLSLGTGGVTTTGPVVHFLRRADVVLAVGTSLTRHPMHITVPPGKTIIHATNDPRDINKDYKTEHPILGDAKLVLKQFIRQLKRVRGPKPKVDDSLRKRVGKMRNEWLAEWQTRLTSREKPINPYRVIWEFMRVVRPEDAIVTHDSGSPRDQLIPFYRAVTPRGYLGWGKSHALGTGLGLIMGAKLAAPEKFCANFMGDAAFGMTGLDFETASRCKIPITTVLLNNSLMGSERGFLVAAHERFGARALSGNYAEMARAMGGETRRVENPEDVAAAISYAVEMNRKGRPVLLEFITKEEPARSHASPF